MKSRSALSSAPVPMDVFFFWCQCLATGFIGGVVLFALAR